MTLMRVVMEETKKTTELTKVEDNIYIYDKNNSKEGMFDINSENKWNYSESKT